MFYRIFYLLEVGEFMDFGWGILVLFLRVFLEVVCFR